MLSAAALTIVEPQGSFHSMPRMAKRAKPALRSIVSPVVKFQHARSCAAGAARPTSSPAAGRLLALALVRERSRLGAGPGPGSGGAAARELGDRGGADRGIGRGDQPLEDVHRAVTHRAERPDEADPHLRVGLALVGGLDRGGRIGVADVVERPGGREADVAIAIAEGGQQGGGRLLRLAASDGPRGHFAGLGVRVGQQTASASTAPASPTSPSAQVAVPRTLESLSWRSAFASAPAAA